MIIADEHIDDRIIAAIRKIPVSVVSIKESYRGIFDEDIIFLSKKLNKIILTEDKDFGEWVFAHKIIRSERYIFTFSFFRNRKDY